MNIIDHCLPNLSTMITEQLSTRISQIAITTFKASY